MCGKCLVQHLPMQTVHAPGAWCSASAPLPLAKFNYPASFQSDYAAYPPPASSYPPPKHHYSNYNHNHHHHHLNNHHNNHLPSAASGLTSSASAAMHHHQQPNHHHNLQQNYTTAHNSSPHYGLHHNMPFDNNGTSNPAAQYHQQQDTDFGAVGSMMGSRRLLDMPMGHSGSGSVAAAMGGGGGGGDTHQHHHLSASSTSSLSGHSTNPRGASYNGIGGSGTTNLIINYLPQDMNDRELFSLFRTMGPIESCRIMRDFKVR